ncbi:Gfo/Idh/MocA family protein [Candidatus Latescibacterota bacterium]
MKETTFGVNRRQYMKNLGAAGLGAMAMLQTPAHADTGRITSSRFQYPYRTFGANEEIRVGMIGNVGHASLVLNGLPDTHNTRLVAYAVMGKKDVKVPAGATVYDHYEEMLDKEQLDVVGVCLPYYQNATASIAAAQRKIHVITEKPVATTLSDMNALLHAVTVNKIRLTTMLNMRVDPHYLAIKDSITAGDIGEPVLATAQKSYRFGESRPEFYKKTETYGGTIPWIGIHCLDYIHYTTNLDYTDVAAFQSNLDHPDYKPGFQDNVGMLLKLSNGGTAMINLDYLRPETATTHGDDRLRIVGSEGVIEIKDSGARIELISSTREAYDIPLPEGKSLFADFIAELRGEGKHILSPEEPFEMTRVALIAHLAAEQHRIITL